MKKIMRRKILAIFLALTMIAALMPTQSTMAAEAPEGYTSDENGIMAYEYAMNYTYSGINGFSMKGYYKDSWRQIFYNDWGIQTLLEVNGGENESFFNVYVPERSAYVNATGSPEVAGLPDYPALMDTSGLTVDIDSNFLYDGKVLQLFYTVKNTSLNDLTFALGSYTKSQLNFGSPYDGTADSIEPFDGGLKVISNKASDEGAQLNFWYDSGIDGVTPVDTCWYGNYTLARRNTFTDLSNKTSLDSTSPGCSWSWKNRSISAGESQTFSVLFSLDGPGSEILTKEYTVNYSTTLGTKPVDVTVVEETAVTLPTLTAPGYEFGGWYSDYGLTSYVGGANESYTPIDNITLYAKWTAIQSPVNVTLTKDGGIWTGQSLALYQGGYYKCALIESDSSGIYSASIGNGTYDIYKDGVDTGEDMVVDTSETTGTGDAVFVIIGYRTLTTTTLLDDSQSSEPGVVDYRINDGVEFSTTGSDGTYVAIVRDTNTSIHDIYVNGLDSDQNISTIDNSATVNYFTGQVEVTLDGAAYEDRSVVLSRSVGTNTYYYTATDDDSDGVYTLMLPSGSSNDYTYNVSVDGRILSDTVSYADKTATAAYYTAHVDVEKDGSDWSGEDVSVYLENDGVVEELIYTDSTDYQHILFSDGSVYKVMVSGSNSPQDTGFELSDNIVQTISYYTVNFFTTNDGSAYTSRVIQKDQTVSRPAAPNVTGKSFDDWYTTAERTDTYDYSSVISDTTTIYANYVDPAVLINATVMDSSTYTIVNLTITGFPSTGTPVKTAILSVDNGTIAVSSESGYTVTGSDSKAVTVTFGDDGASMEAAQEFLRNNTVVTPMVIGTAQTLTVTVCGDTSEGTVATSTTEIYLVTLELNGGRVNSGSLSYYEKSVGAILPTDVSYSGYTFDGWYEDSEFAGSEVTEISDTDSGQKSYYAKWTASDNMIDFGTLALDSDGSFTYPELELTSSIDTFYNVVVTVENASVSVETGDDYSVYYNIGNTTATINLGEGMSADDVQTLIQENVSFTDSSFTVYPVVKITLDGNTTVLPSEATISAGNGVVGLNGHYYMYVPNDGIDWNSAYNAAKSYTYMGMQGYLVTVTSAEEDTALDLLTTDSGWAGGIRLTQTTYDQNSWEISSTVDDYWRWVCGPEAGTVFYYGSTGEGNASAVDSSGNLVADDSADAVYTHWTDGEPNHCDQGDSGYENTLMIHYAVDDVYKWNDIVASSSGLAGYFVEFGGYPDNDEEHTSVDANKSVTGTNIVKAPFVSGDTIYTNDAAIIVKGSNAYWDMDCDGVLDDSEDNTSIYSSVSASTTIHAGTTEDSTAPYSGQITVLTGSTVGEIDGGNVNGPVCVKLSGDVDVTINLNNIIMVEVIDTLTCDSGDVKFTAYSDLDARRVLAMDETGGEIIDITKFTLNGGDNAVIAIGNELQISEYGVNTTDSVTTTLMATPPTYNTATVEVRENGILADAESVVLKTESGDSITLNRSATGVYSYTDLMDDTTKYTLYVDGVAVGSSYAAFASTATVNQAPNYYTAEVTYKVNDTETDAQSVILKADGKDDITLIQQTDDDSGDLVTGVYEYRALTETTEYSIWVNDEDSGEKLKFESGDYQKTVNRYSIEVSLTNSGAWSGQTVTLRDDSGDIIYTLSETDINGTYSVLTDSDYVGTYSLYVNSEDSGEDIKPSTTDKASLASMDYMTVTITTNQDGTPTRLGTVTVGGETARETSTGNYIITLPSDSYTVSVAGTNVGNVTSSGDSLTVNAFTVTYDENGATGTVPTDDTLYFSGSTVTVLSNGDLSKEGTLFAGWQTGGITYYLGDTFTIIEATTLTAQWGNTTEAQVSWTIDDTTYYGTIFEAITAAENTDLPVSVIIQNDVTITEDMTIPDNVMITLPEGNTITVEENITLTNEGTINSNGTITGDGTLDNNGTIDNVASADTSGTIDITTNNADGIIEGGMIASGITVSGGDITGTVVNNGTINGADVTGDVTNNGTLTNVDITGDVDNEGTVENTVVNGNMDNVNGTVSDSSVSGNSTAPGGSVSTAGELIEALGGAAHIDEETGAVVLDGDVALDETITIVGCDIEIDLNGYTITGPSSDGEDGDAAIEVTGGVVDIEDNSTNGGGSIIGGSGSSGDGGNGITVSGGNVTVGEDVTVIGGDGGISESGASGDGGSGILVSENAEVTIEGIVFGGSGGDGTIAGSGGDGVETSGTVTVSITGYVIGGSGGAGETAGSGGTGITNEGTETVTLNGTVTGGSGGFGDTAGSGGSGVTNNSTGTVEVSSTVTGGSGGMNVVGETADSGISLSGTIIYSVLESGLTHMELANGSETTVETENGLVKDDTDITLECCYTALYDMPTSVALGIYNSSTSTTKALDSSYYAFDSTTGVITIFQNTSVTGNLVITAEAIKKSGTVTITTSDELIEALENGFSDIVVNGSISIDEEVTVPSSTIVSVASGETITVAEGGSITNIGTITGEGDVTVANGGSITNDGCIDVTITNNGIVNQVEGASEIMVTGIAAVIVWKVTYDVKGVGTVPNAAFNVTALPNPLPTPTGSSKYTFNGWFMDSSCITLAVGGTSITGNTVLYGGWTYTGGSSDSSDDESNSEVFEGPVPVIIDGNVYDIGTVETSDGITTVIPDEGELTSQIESAELGGEVVVPITLVEGVDRGAAVLVLKTIEDMDKKNMALTTEVGSVALTLPASSIDTAFIATTLGADNHEQVLVKVILTSFSGISLETILEDVESTGAEAVGTAFSFTITAEYGGESVDVTAFGRFTTRKLPVEDNREITTAVVVEEDGTLRHVPTNGTNNLAIVSSLTNSTYILINNEQSFTDAEGTWYEAVVSEMASRKIINGVGDDLFAGERSITRAEFTAMLVRALGLPSDGKANFEDVTESAWYAGAVGTAYEYGIVNGKSADSFAPMDNITRQEAMVMVARAAEIAELEDATVADLSEFADDESIDAWAKSYVEYNVANELIVGDNNGNLNPQRGMTRAEAATIILRLLRNANLIDVRS